MKKWLRNILFSGGLWWKSECPNGHRLSSVGWMGMHSRTEPGEIISVKIKNWNEVLSGCNNPLCDWNRSNIPYQYNEPRVRKLTVGDITIEEVYDD